MTPNRAAPSVQHAARTRREGDGEPELDRMLGGDVEIGGIGCAQPPMLVRGRDQMMGDEQRRGGDGEGPRRGPDLVRLDVAAPACVPAEPTG